MAWGSGKSGHKVVPTWPEWLAARMRERTRKGGLGWRVVDLARAARVRHDVAGGWLNGRTPDPYHLRPLAHALRADLQDATDTIRARRGR